MIPGESRKAVKIRHGHGVSHPVRVEANVRNARKSAESAMEHLARDNVLDRSSATIYAHIEIQRLFPHRNEKAKVALLSQVFLGDLQFNGLVGFLKATQKGRRRLAHLKIDGAVLDLDDDVVIELAIERMKNVVSGPGSVIFGIAPVKMMVVHKRTIHDNAAVRLQGPCNSIGRVRRRASVTRRAGAAFGVRLHQEPSEVWN